MTRPAADVERVARLLSQGVSQAETARRTGVPRGTVRTWIGRGIDQTLVDRTAAGNHGPGTCRFAASVPPEPYAYLLGLYLGDGCVSATKRGVYRLRVALDTKYPGIIEECRSAMASVLPNRVGVIQCAGCVHVSAYSTHWICLFPQHGAGPKHGRPILLEPWQEGLALEQRPRSFLRGLIHSDGYRGMNRIAGRYEYPRYLFSNRSDDIRELFVRGCARLGVAARPMGRWQVSVARREDVALLDTFIGPKR